MVRSDTDRRPAGLYEIAGVYRLATAVRDRIVPQFLARCSGGCRRIRR